MKFIDLYAGIGGIRFAFEQAGGECVFSSEWNKYAQITYHALHGETPHGDITFIDPSDIPDHDILTAGFPCQPFSLAGVSKKNSLGRKHGFEDLTQGTEFFKVKEILKQKQPKAFLLENVKNLKSHDGGKTITIIEQTLDEIGYDFQHRIIDSSYWVPQHRERIFFIGFHKNLKKKEQIKYLFPEYPERRLYELNEMLESTRDIARKYGDKYTIPAGTWAALQRHKEKHAAKGNGFGHSMIYPPFKGQVTRTLSARYYKDGAEVLLNQGRDRRPRKLTPLEAYRLQGFPVQFEYLFNGVVKELQPVSDLQSYKQFGNSVTVPVIASLAQNIANALNGIPTEPITQPIFQLI